MSAENSEYTWLPFQSAHITTLLQQGIAEVIPAGDDLRLNLLMQRQHQQLLDRRAAKSLAQQLQVAEGRAEHLANLAALPLDRPASRRAAATIVVRFAP